MNLRKEIQFVSQSLNRINAIQFHRSGLISPLWLIRHHSNGSKPKRTAKEKIAEIDSKQSYNPNDPIGLWNRLPKNDPNQSSMEENRSVNSEKIDCKTETKTAFEAFPNNQNPETGEKNGPTGPEPTRFGDWERKGRCSDF